MLWPVEMGSRNSASEAQILKTLIVVTLIEPFKGALEGTKGTLFRPLLYALKRPTHPHSKTNTCTHSPPPPNPKSL